MENIKFKAYGYEYMGVIEKVMSETKLLVKRFLISGNYDYILINKKQII